MYKLKGKTILVGFTYVDKENKVIERKQFFGKIISANSQTINILTTHTGRIISIPPDMSAIKRAKKGEYRLHSTNEIIKNPDYISTWIVKKD